MKNLKPLAIGFVAGAACMVSTVAIAASNEVTAQLFNDAFFNINGEIVATPSDQPILNYNNRAYVPIRFVADQLGCEVGWDYATKQVKINYEPKVIETIKEVEVEKIVYVDSSEDDNEDKQVYSSIPTSKRGDNFTISLTGLVQKSDTVYTDQATKLFLTLENTSTSERIQLVPGECKLEVDGKTYAQTKLTSMRDSGWYNDIQPKDDNSDDDKYDGYLLFDQIPEDWEKGKLTLTVRTNGTNTSSEEVVIYFKN